MEAENLDLENQETLEIPSQVTGFRVANDFFGISVLDIQEVVKPQIVTPVPLVAPHFRGLINLRGQIVTSISLRTLFGLEDDLGKDHMNVIVGHEGGLFALVVDEIQDVIYVDKKSFEGPPENLDPQLKRFVSGVFKLESSLLSLLDLKKVLSF
jgi:purine-binding chemotaxis protein CheW